MGAVREVQTKAVSDFGAMGALHSHDNQNHGHGETEQHHAQHSSNQIHCNTSDKRSISSLIPVSCGLFVKPIKFVQ